MYEEMKEILGRFKIFTQKLIDKDAHIETFKKHRLVTRQTIDRIERAYEVHQIRLDEKNSLLMVIREISKMTCEHHLKKVVDAVNQMSEKASPKE